MLILVVDDDPMMRALITRILSLQGHDVIAASNGERAWEKLQEQKVDVVFSDWMMPGLDGPDLCRRIRQAKFDNYIYFILCSGRDSHQDLIEGLAAGADNFITKPLHQVELKVRLRGAERIHEMESRLHQKQKRLADAYQRLEEDLNAAAQLNRSLIPEALDNGPIRIRWLFSPSNFLGGDFLNYFKLDERHLCLYLLDVSGHGVPACLHSIHLASILSPRDSDRPPLRTSSRLATPAEVALNLNEHFQTQDDMYFTMLYLLLDLETHQATLCQAGHPKPLLHRVGREIERVGESGFPIGLLPQAEYDNIPLDLSGPCRLFLFSDGVLDCRDAELRNFGEERLIACIDETGHLPIDECIGTLQAQLAEWSGGHLEDDLSLVCLEIGASAGP